MHGPTLEVNLAAIARNYALLKERAGGKCAAVVKADAYGLGVVHVASALYGAGCTEFFVATLEEGMALRKTGPRGQGAGAVIYVFHGARKGEAREFAAHGLIPVLNSPEQIEAWDSGGPCALHVDTGMNRLGLSLKETQGLKHFQPQLIMSHLACANEPDNPMNKRQLKEFRKALEAFPRARVRASLANSSGIFLGPDFHFDLVRPGCSLYGISPNTALENPMEKVAALTAPVLQYRTVEKTQSVGYGATAKAKAGSVLAIVELGYADGLPRSLSNKAHGIAAGWRVPLLGRVSMDMVIFDVTSVPQKDRTPDLRVTLIGEGQPVDALAKDAGTIGYEIFTRIGARVKRVYKYT